MLNPSKKIYLNLKTIAMQQRFTMDLFHFHMWRHCYLHIQGSRCWTSAVRCTPTARSRALQSFRAQENNTWNVRGFSAANRKQHFCLLIEVTRCRGANSFGCTSHDWQRDHPHARNTFIGWELRIMASCSRPRSLWCAHGDWHADAHTRMQRHETKHALTN